MRLLVTGLRSYKNPMRLFVPSFKNTLRCRWQAQQTIEQRSIRHAGANDNSGAPIALLVALCKIMRLVKIVSL